MATQTNVDRVEVIKSNKGHFKIIYKGFMYTKHKSFNNVTRWRCAARGCCKGSIMTSNDFTRPTPKMSHTHPPDYRACELAKARYLIPQVNTVVLKKENLQGNETPETYTSPKIENVPAVTRGTPMAGGIRFMPGEYQSNDVIMVNDPSTHFMDLLYTLIRYEMDTPVNRDVFFEKLLALVASKREDNCFHFSREKYSKILSEVISAKAKCSTPLDYRRLKRFDVLEINGEGKLIAPLKPGEANVQYYVTNDELFSILSETHIRTCHGGRTRMLKELQLKYKNITYEVVMLFLNLCEQCQMKPGLPKKVPPANSVQAQQQSTPHSSPQSQPQPSPPPAISQKKSNLPPLAPKPAPGPKLPQSSPGPSSSIKQLPKLLPKPQSPPEVCLRWNSYHSNMQNTFPSLLNNEQFVDVTLACDGRSIKCHKVMLSACSPYMEELLSSNPCQHPIIFLKDMKFWQLQALIDFMYRGEVNVTQDKLPSLLSAAEALQIKGLASPVNHSAPPKITQIQPMPSTQHDIPEEMDQVTYMRHLQLQTDIKNEYDDDYMQDTDESPPPTPKAKKRKASHTVSQSSGNSNGTGGGAGSSSSTTNQTKPIIVNKPRRDKERHSEPSTSHQISNTTTQALSNQHTSTTSGTEHRRKSDNDKMGTGTDSENEYKSYSEDNRHSTQDEDMDLDDERAEIILERYSSQNDDYSRGGDGDGDGGGDMDDNSTTSG